MYDDDDDDVGGQAGLVEAWAAVEHLASRRLIAARAGLGGGW